MPKKEKELTVQARIKKILMDGKPHSKTDLRTACCHPQSKAANITTHICHIRKTLPKGYAILSVNLSSKKYGYYQMVKLLPAALKS